MNQLRRPHKAKIALVGSKATPVLFTALKIAYGLAGAWEKIIVVGCSPKNETYQHLGAYNTLYLAPDAPPSRYAELLNICGGCGKDVVIFSSLSQEWRDGVTQHLKHSYYPDLLRAHNSFLKTLRHFPAHVIGCMEMERPFFDTDSGAPKFNLARRVVQQPGFEKTFTNVLQLDKKGRATVIKDLSQTLPSEPFYPAYQTGALHQDWCKDGKPSVSEDLQQKINDCSNLKDLYQLLFGMDIDDTEMLSAFVKKRLELEGAGDRPPIEILEGGLT